MARISAPPGGNLTLGSGPHTPGFIQPRSRRSARWRSRDALPFAHTRGSPRMPFGIGPLELVIVLVIILVIFGPKRLPQAGRALGQGLREFKDSVTGKDKDSDPEASELPSAEQPVEQPVEQSASRAFGRDE